MSICFKKCLLAPALIGATLSACSPLGVPSVSQEYAAEPAIAASTSSQRLLESLPPTERPIIVSVYAFTDQTGQHKPDELPQYSRAVTQGGLAFLKKALWDAGEQGWFRVLERGGLANLLKEREIVRSVRAQYRTPEGEQLQDLGPLLYSGLLLEGGIIAYESNEITGGFGARYLGIGGFTEYRRDIVTVSLRAVSVTTGEVVAAVTTSKTIFSLGVSGGVFKYVTFDELLETEAGFSMNEPPQLAVRQAIELAVYSLIMSGYEKGLWSFADSEAGRRAYEDYAKRFNIRGQPPALQPAVGKSPPPPQEQPRVSTNSGTKSSASKLRSQQTAPAAEVKTATLRLTDPPLTHCHPDLPETSAELEQGFYFQVAALTSDESNAGIIRDSFLREGLPIALQRAMVSGSPFCRILVGPFQNLSMALQQQTRVNDIAAVCTGGSSQPFIRQIK